jgi:fimbrial chaperone protein
MVVVRGIISKAQLRNWLENWLSFTTGDLLPDAPAINSGAKSRDGVTGGQINKIMLDDAINRLPSELRRVIYLRWTSPGEIKLRDALRALGVQKSEYYRRCDVAVDMLYDRINGLAINYANLYENIH